MAAYLRSEAAEVCTKAKTTSATHSKDRVNVLGHCRKVHAPSQPAHNLALTYSSETVLYTVLFRIELYFIEFLLYA